MHLRDHLEALKRQRESKVAEIADLDKDIKMVKAMIKRERRAKTTGEEMLKSNYKSTLELIAQHQEERRLVRQIFRPSHLKPQASNLSGASHE